MKVSYLNFILVIFFIFKANAQSHKEELETFRTELNEELQSESPLARTDSTNTGWELVAGKDAKKVNLKWSPKNFYYLSFLLSAPLDDDAEKTSIYRSDTDAFVNSTSITVSSSYMFASNANDIDLHDELVKVCLATPTLFSINDGEKDKECYKKSEDDLVTAAKNSPLGSKAREVIENLKKDFLNPFYKMGASATYGNKSFNYFEPQDGNAENSDVEYNPLKTLDEREHPSGAEVFFSYIKPYYFQGTLAFEFQKDFKTPSKGKKETRCAITDSELTYSTCKEALLGAPERVFNRNIKLSVILPLEYYTTSIFSHATISPVFTYNTANDVRSWKIPVYFIANKDGSLNAGVTYDFESGDDGYEYFGFFLGGKY